MIVRKASKEEAARIAKMERAVFSDAWSEAGILETMCQHTASVYVASVENTIAGYAIVYTVMDEGELVRIAVDSMFRRQGVAGSLLDTLIREWQDHGILLWHLEVRKSNDAAQGLYRSRGFSKDGIRRGFYENPREDAVLMSLRLETLSGVQEE